jgi:hypothetical protein
MILKAETQILTLSIPKRLDSILPLCSISSNTKKAFHRTLSISAAPLLREAFSDLLELADVGTPVLSKI